MRFFRTRLVLAAAMTIAAFTPAQAFELKSADIANNGKLKATQVNKGFGCDGGNLSPQLQWSGVPKGTKSFAVTVFDPDAPTGSGWWHWVVYDIPASVAQLKAGAAAKLPEGAKHGPNDFSQPTFAGACPPQGSKHRYITTIYALKVDKLDLPADASPAMIGFMVNANKLGSAKITATLQR